MLERYKAAQNDEDVQILKNKPPKWNEQVGLRVRSFSRRLARRAERHSLPRAARSSPRTPTRPYGSWLKVAPSLCEDTSPSPTPARWARTCSTSTAGSRAPL
jgi:hypothetical protein